MNERTASLATLTLLLDSIADFAYLKDTAGRYLAINASAAEAIGKTPQEVVGQDDFALFPAAHAQRIRDDDQALFRSGLPSMTFEEEFPYSGGLRSLQTIKNICRDNDGNLVGLVGVARDVTERKGLERELAQRSRELSEAHRLAGLGTWSWDSRTDKTIWSEETFRIFGRDPALGEPGYQEIWAAHSLEGRALLAAGVDRALRNGTPYEHDVQIALPDGSIRWITARGEVEAWEHGKVVKLRGTLHEITDRKRVEEELRQSNERLRTVLDTITEGHAVFDRDWRYTYFNEQGARILGVKVKELLGQRVWERLPSARTTKTQREYTRALETQTPVHFEEFYPEPLNKWLECHGYPTEHGLTVYFRDITDRKRIENALLEAEGRYRNLFESNLMGIAHPDRFGAFKGGNDELLRITGYSRAELEAGKVRWDSMTPPEYAAIDAAHIAEAAERGSCTPYEKEYIRKDGSRIPILCGYALLDGSQDEYVGFVLDLTPQKRMEEALRRSEKLATAGRLAASIAHEINNPLEAVTNALYLALQDPGLTGNTKTFLQMAEQELSRVAHITTQSLRFYKQSRDSSLTDLAEIMDSVLTMFTSRLNARQILVQREFGSGTCIDCFSDEIRQVFANFISNSLDATAQGGRIRIRIRRSNAWGAHQTPGVRVLIADTGCGIPQQMTPRLFEPFFSTKDATGLGLGLWVSDGILRKHHGRVSVRSRTDHLHGTVIALFFPHLQGRIAPALQTAVGAGASGS